MWTCLYINPPSCRCPQAVQDCFSSACTTAVNVNTATQPCLLHSEYLRLTAAKRLLCLYHTLMIPHASSVVWGSSYIFFSCGLPQTSCNLEVSFCSLVFVKKFCFLRVLHPKETICQFLCRSAAHTTKSLLAQGTFVIEVECVQAHKKARGLKIYCPNGIIILSRYQISRAGDPYSQQKELLVSLQPPYNETRSVSEASELALTVCGNKVWLLGNFRKKSPF